MSTVISFRLDAENPREAQAIDVLHAWTAVGHSVRYTLTEALLKLEYPEPLPNENAYPPAPGGKSVSGDIVVSAPTCLFQTQGWKEPPEARVFFFVLHGMLHLAGYDHEAGGAQARRMRRKELHLYRRVLAGSGGHSSIHPPGMEGRVSPASRYGEGVSHADE